MQSIYRQTNIFNEHYNRYASVFRKKILPYKVESIVLILFFLENRTANTDNQSTY